MTAPHTALIARAIVRNGGAILTVRRKGQKWPILPGGHVEPGEPVESALARDFVEELAAEVTVTGFGMQSATPTHTLSALHEFAKTLENDPGPKPRAGGGWGSDVREGKPWHRWSSGTPGKNSRLAERPSLRP
ncbi:hypothetical protein GCM10027059_34560 [Myceligenerans halotolerans]